MGFTTTMATTNADDNGSEPLSPHVETNTALELLSRYVDDDGDGLLPDVIAARTTPSTSASRNLAIAALVVQAATAK